MNRLATAIKLLAVFLCLTSSLFAAQVRAKIPEPKIERTWEEVEGGLWAWTALDVDCDPCKGRKKLACVNCAEHETKLENCKECKAEDLAPCRTCAGTGKALDPLDYVTCPYCSGSSIYICRLCRGFGDFPEQGAGDRRTPCGGCKKVGSHDCPACEGTRRIPSFRVKKKAPGEASVKDLKKVRETLQETLAELEKFQPDKSASKTVKNFTSLVKPLSKPLPAVAQACKLYEAATKGLSRGSNFTGYDTWVLAQNHYFQDRTIYLLRHQLLLADLCITFAEHNESVDAKK